MKSLFNNKSKISSYIVPFILLITSVICLFFPVIIKSKGILFNDQAMWDFPFHYNFAYYLQKGIMPLWYPQIWTGSNIGHYALCLWGDTNYYPVVWPFYFMANLNDLDKSYWMITILPLMFHYILAATGMFVLTKKIFKCNSFASFIGAFSYIYSPMAIYGQFAMETLIPLAWIPWLLFIYINVVRQKKLQLWNFFLGTIIFAFIWVGTRPLIMPFVMVIWLSFTIMLMIRKKFSMKPLFVTLSMFILGTCLGAIKIYPIWEGYQTTKIHMALSYNAHILEYWGMLSYPYLATLFLPNLFGNITGDNFYFKRFMFWEGNMSGGIATTLSIIIAVVFPFISSNKKKFAKPLFQYAILGAFLYVFSIICAMGANTPFYKLFIGWVPFVGGLPFPIRFRMVQCFAASLLIAIGIHSLCYFFIPKKNVIDLIFDFLMTSFFIIVVILFFLKSKDLTWRMPDNFGFEQSLSWVGHSPLDVDDFEFFKKGPAGEYTPKTAKVKKIRALFNGESKGEIRYSSNHEVEPQEGTFVKNYYVSKKGWHVFDVDIPPNKFLWILPKTIDNGIGYWEAHEESFNYMGGDWFLNIGLRPMGFQVDYGNKNYSLFQLLKKGYIVPDPVIGSLIYWAVVSLLIILGINLFSTKNFGYLLGIIILLEFFIYGTMAFYGGKGDCEINRIFPPINYRATRPMDSPTIKRLIKEVPPLTPDPTLRIATDHPMQEINALINNRFYLMAYANYPIETRFKHALEAAYGQRVYYDLNFVITRPKHIEFLNNFSVGYYLTRNFYKIFDDETSEELKESPNFFIHTNKQVLPRVYTLDRIIATSDKEQLNNLVSGDLRKAIYVNSGDINELNKNVTGDYVQHFEELQSKNSIHDLDLSNPNEINLGIDVNIPAMLVFTEVWYPGWEAIIDGKKSKIIRVNYCQRGVWLGKGHHKVKLIFKPASWAIGAIISLTTLLLLFMFFIWSILKIIIKYTNYNIRIKKSR